MNDEILDIGGISLRVHRWDTVIVGAGAAGMNAAVHLAEFRRGQGDPQPGGRIAVVAGSLRGGASRMSGSDKQTYYKLGTAAETADSACSMAESLTAAGCCHEDLALIEAANSLREFYHLVACGVPFPCDGLGAFIGYKTDHDPFERATSAGPRTSRMMSECLEAEARRLGVTMIGRQEAVRLITRGSRSLGLLTLDQSDGRWNLYLANFFILAAGGPGELYRTSVYPFNQPGMTGICLRAGMRAENLSESQFGLAGRKFRWNVSGTYLQAIPRMFSTAADGRSDPREFLGEGFPSLRRMATAIFLKGYQWPFDPQRIAGGQSSLADMLVDRETRQGRQVWLDYQNNPRTGDDAERFDLDDLEPEAREYLRQAGARQERPIDRLRQMNPPAVEVFAEHGIDLAAEPLEIAVSHQHCNGGMAVDRWWRSPKFENGYVIGELAGTHGVKRPGGSALNAGQVGGLRVAAHIAHTAPAGPCLENLTGEEQKDIAETCSAYAGKPSGIEPRQCLDRLQAVMDDSGGYLRSEAAAQQGIAELNRLNGSVAEQGFAITDLPQAVAAVRASHLLVTGLAVLESVLKLLRNGSGSRGSHLVLDKRGEEIHPALKDETGKPLKARPENCELRNRIVSVRYDETRRKAVAELIPVRRVTLQRKAFETAWHEFREGNIYT